MLFAAAATTVHPPRILIPQNRTVLKMSLTPKRREETCAMRTSFLMEDFLKPNNEFGGAFHENPSASCESRYGAAEPEADDRFHPGSPIRRFSQQREHWRFWHHSSPRASALRSSWPESFAGGISAILYDCLSAVPGKHRHGNRELFRTRSVNFLRPDQTSLCNATQD